MGGERWAQRGNIGRVYQLRWNEYWSLWIIYRILPQSNQGNRKMLWKWCPKDLFPSLSDSLQPLIWKRWIVPSWKHRIHSWMKVIQQNGRHRMHACYPFPLGSGSQRRWHRRKCFVWETALGADGSWLEKERLDGSRICSEAFLTAMAVMSMKSRHTVGLPWDNCMTTKSPDMCLFFSVEGTEDISWLAKSHNI